MLDQTLSVSEASNLLNETLKLAVPAMIIEGEVSGFNVNRGKFVFFDLKDDNSILPCFMMAFALKFPIEDGMKIRVLVEPGITSKGRFSLTVRELQPVGEGSLKKAFEILKKKLEAEGLFDAERKRALPQYPQSIGVVSSSGAAGWADFVKILDERWGGLNIQLADVTVQGLNAPGEVVGAIEHFNAQAQLVDVLVVIRGGGSADDLAAFNHEDVVRAVSASRIPTVVGIGHETDESLAELAADLRASTPSNVAQLIVPDKKEVLLRAGRVVEISKNGIAAAIRVFDEDVQVIVSSITKSLDSFLVREFERLNSFKQTINQVNPETVLRRGYGLIKKGEVILSSTANVIVGEEISIQLKDGEVGAGVTYVKPSK